MTKQILDLVELQQQLDNSETYEDEEGNKIQTIYLGSILSLTPSGKIYYPFAHSNVDNCPKCKDGSGQIRNPHGKRKKYEKLEKKQKELIKQMVGTGIHFYNLSQKTQRKLIKVRKQLKWWNPWITCNECYGLGSLEARLDQDWWEELERELETINAWHHGSEGDGCDVMISRAVTDGAKIEELNLEV